MTRFFSLLIAILVLVQGHAHASDMGGFNVPANKILAGPTAGGNSTATYRSAVAADIPALDFSKISTGVVPILQGGSGQTTATTAFDAFSPLGAKGDTLVYNSTTGHNVKFTACADGDQIQFDSTVAGIGIKCVVPASGTGSVTSVSVAAANGFTGTVATATTTPAITIIASGCNGVCKSNATTLSTAGASDITGQLLTGFSSGAGTVASTDTILQGFNKLAGNQAGFLPTAGTGLVEVFTGHIVSPGNYTFVLDQSAAYAYTINSVIVQTSSGTDTLALKIGGTNVTGCSAVSVSSTPATGTCTAANSVSTTNRVTLVTSADATAVDLTFTVKVTR